MTLQSFSKATKDLFDFFSSNELLKMRVYGLKKLFFRDKTEVRAFVTKVYGCIF